MSWAGSLERCPCLGKTLAANFTGFRVESPVVWIWSFVEDEQELWLGVCIHVTSMNMGCDTMIPTRDQSLENS